MDDDCDGDVDEGDNACGGVCELVNLPESPCDGDDSDLCLDDVYECSGANDVVCSLGDDNVEICNDVDDDCDGDVDEGTFPEIPEDCLSPEDLPPPPDGIYILYCGDEPGTTWSIAEWGCPDDGDECAATGDWVARCDAGDSPLCRILRTATPGLNGYILTDIRYPDDSWGCEEDASAPFVWVRGRQLCSSEVLVDRRDLSGHSCFWRFSTDAPE